MSYTHDWYVPQRVIYARVWGDQDIDEIARSSAGLSAMLNEGKPLIHILMDDSKIGNVPVNLGQLRNTMTFARNPSLGWVVLIGDASRVSKFIVEMLGKIFRIPVYRAQTLEEAVSFLRSRDITVPWQEADETVATHS